jgi:hypothetical protein
MTSRPQSHMTMKRYRFVFITFVKDETQNLHGYDGGHIIPITNVKAELSLFVIVWQGGRYINKRPLPYILIYTYDLLHSKIKVTLSSSCFTSGTRRVTLVANPVTSHARGKDRKAITTSETYPWSFVTQMFYTFMIYYTQK